MAKGKFFEQLVHIIQQTLKDHSETVVYQNKRLKSRTGRVRQFDVLIETTINDYPLRLAIECKDHGRKVEAGAIEAFSCKCDLVPNIHKKIFVSNAGFQIGAIESANYLGVELHVLEQVSGEQINKWINTQEIYTHHHSINAKSYHFTIINDEDYTYMKPIEFTDIVYYADGQSSTCLKFLEDLLNAQTIQAIKNVMMLMTPDLLTKGTLSEEHPIEFSQEILLGYAYFLEQGRKFFIKKVDFKVGVIIHQEKIQPDIRIMHSPERNTIQASVLTFPLEEDGSKHQMVIDPEGKMKEYIINSDGSIRHELKLLAKYNSKTKKYEFPSGLDMNRK